MKNILHASFHAALAAGPLASNIQQLAAVLALSSSLVVGWEAYPGMPTFPGMPTLSQPVLSSSSFTCPIPDIARLTNLRSLALRVGRDWHQQPNTDIPALALAPLAALQHLADLSISMNAVGYPAPPLVCTGLDAVAQSCRQLRKLTLFHVRLTALKAVESPSLQHLAVGRTAIDGGGGGISIAHLPLLFKPGFPVSGLHVVMLTCLACPPAKLPLLATTHSTCTQALETVTLHGDLMVGGLSRDAAEKIAARLRTKNAACLDTAAGMGLRVIGDYEALGGSWAEVLAAVGPFNSPGLALRHVEIEEGCMAKLGALARGVETLWIDECAMSKSSLLEAVQSMPRLRGINIDVGSAVQCPKGGLMMACKAASRLRPLHIRLQVAENELGDEDPEEYYPACRALFEEWDKWAAQRSLPHKTQVTYNERF